MKKLPDGSKTPAFLQQLHWIANPVGYLEQTAAEGYDDILQLLAS